MKLFFATLAVALFVFCAKNYKDVIRDTEKSFYSGNYSAALPDLRNLVKESDTKDKLLYLMEAGIVLHTNQEYEKSNNAFLEASDLADTIKTSVTKTGLSFMLSDNESNFQGEDFERVMIRFYIALNHTMLGNYEDAKRFFRKVDYDLKDLKVTDPKYKQNLMARYMDAVISENTNRYNDARVQYKNILDIDPSKKEILADRYVLAVKEGSTSDMGVFAEGKNYLNSFDASMQPVAYDPNTMGEVIIIHQAGKAATKESRGKLLSDQFLGNSLKTSFQANSFSGGSDLDLGVVAAVMARAENPIPIYKVRDEKSSMEKTLTINGKIIGTTKILNDYSATTIKAFNDNYTSIVTKNVASLAAKFVTAAIASKALSDSIEKSLNRGKQKNPLISMGADLISGLAAGAAVSSTVAPDLRCWRLMPSNFQAKRIFLKPGEYTYKLAEKKGTFKIEAGKPTFINIRTFEKE